MTRGATQAPDDLPCDGTKRCYPSRRAVALAHQTARFRVRAYFCKPCRAWHATAQEKRT